MSDTESTITSDTPYPNSFEEWFSQLTTKDIMEILWNRYTKEEQQEFWDQDNNSEEEDEDDYFNRKYPDASCHRCDKRVDADTVVFCKDECETWYCEDCHEAGTYDCDVCQRMNQK